MKEDPDSVLAFYKKLIRLRKENPVIADGEISFADTEKEMVLAYQRMKNGQKLMVFCNLSGEVQDVKIGKDMKSFVTG